MNHPRLLVCAACGTTNRVAGEHLDQEPTCGHCKAELMARRPLTLSDAMLPKFIARTELPLLVVFWAASAPGSRAMAPQLEVAALRLPHARVALLDTEAHPHAAAFAHVRTLPTFVVFNGGRELGRRLGVHRAGELVQWLRELELE